MIPSTLPRFTAIEMKVGYDAGMISTSLNGDYLAAWIEPDGTIVSMSEHACAGDYTALFEAGHIRLLVEIEVAQVSFETAVLPSPEQAQSLINLAAAFSARGGRAVLIGSPAARFSSATADTVYSLREFVSLVRSLQAQPVTA